MTPAGLVILGFGGQGRSVADVALDAGVTELLFIDANARPGESFAGFPVVPELPAGLPPGWAFVAASGDAQRRREMVEAWGLGPFPALISRRAYVGIGASVGEATVVHHHAHLGPMVRVGQGCIINTGAIVDHDASVGDYSHVSVNAVIAGRCRIGRCSFVGVGAAFVDGVAIGDDITIGAGAVVTRDLFEPGVYAGVPARLLRRV